MDKYTFVCVCLHKGGSEGVRDSDRGTVGGREGGRESK